MINTWFTSDFHLGHQNIIRYCSRPFHSTGEMDEAILGNLNSLVVRAMSYTFSAISAWADPSRRGAVGIGMSAAISTLLKGITTARFAT
jgi:hypothetical protein